MLGRIGEMLTGGIPGSWTLVIGGRLGKPGNDTPGVDISPTIQTLGHRSLPNKARYYQINIVQLSLRDNTCSYHSFQFMTI